MLSPNSQTVLPPEVWLKVFSELAHVPGAFSLTDDSAIEGFSEDSEGIVVHKFYCESINAKLAISRVCWQWRHLIMRFLFEYVLIRSSAHAKVVASIFRHFRRTQKASEFYGRWITRIEVYTSDHYWEDEARMDVISILDNAPNVKVFSDLFCPVPSNFMCPQVIDKLQALCEKGHLRRIEWYTGAADQVTSLLKGTPSLQVFILGRSKIMPMCTDITILPHLRVLVVGPHAVPSDLADIDAPNLRSLVMHTRAFHAARGFLPLTASFSALKRLRIRYEDYHNIHDHLEQLRSLEILTFDFGKGFDFKKLSNFQHKSLKRINLVKFPLFHRSLYWHIRYGDWPILCNFMTDLLSPQHLPALMTIGFLIPKSYFSYGPFLTDLKKLPDGFEEFWKPWMKHCKTRDVKLEASLGSDDHFRGLWQHFRENLLPRAHR